MVNVGVASLGRQDLEGKGPPPGPFLQPMSVRPEHRPGLAEMSSQGWLYGNCVPIQHSVTVPLSNSDWAISSTLTGWKKGPGGGVCDENGCPFLQGTLGTIKIPAWHRPTPTIPPVLSPRQSACAKPANQDRGRSRP
ncbi:hypothetical protein M513_08091 [Trichuris suis]|uniref:Uncharacterized protein n=1 Tax=Trichuris suis TaxID=68888 RepID=A0A085M1F4_9BILA|nr:hypothetical protein M513_08091 [Trichuris suis]